MLIDVHAHFYHERSGRADWREVNANRLRAGDRIGITAHVASILGTWGFRSPVYFPSAEDVTYGNDRMLELQRQPLGRLDPRRHQPAAEVDRVEPGRVCGDALGEGAAEGRRRAGRGIVQHLDRARAGGIG